MKNPVCKVRGDETGIFFFAMFTAQQMVLFSWIEIPSFATDQFVACCLLLLGREGNTINQAL